MLLPGQEISDTHMLVVTPEKWDVITRKSSDAALTNLVRLRACMRIIEYMDMYVLDYVRYST